MHKKTDSGLDGFRKERFSRGGMLNRRDSGKDGFRKGWIQERRYTGKEGAGKE